MEPRSAGPRWWQSEQFLDAFSLLIGLRLILGFIALWLWWQQQLPGPCNFELARNGWTEVPPLADGPIAFPLVGVWQHWDACWYTKISTFGYQAGDNSVNFWPLFPLLVGAVQQLLGGAAALAGIIVAGVAYLAAMVGLDRLVTRDVDHETARWTLVLISVFPTAFFFFAPFTESLFLATAVWAIIGARERIWLLAAAAGFLAALTRIQGVFLVLAIGWEVLASVGDARPSAGTVPDTKRSALPAGVRLAYAIREAGAGMQLPDWPSRRPAISQLVAVIAPAVGFATFLVYSKSVAGQTPLDTQDAWGGKDFHLPWEVFSSSWNWAVERHDPLQAFNLLTLIVFAVIALLGLRRLPISYFLFAAPQIALLATRIQPTPLTSTARYLLVVFPVFVMIATVRDVRFRLGWLAGSAVLLALLTMSFLRGDFVA